MYPHPKGDCFLMEIGGAGLAEVIHIQGVKDARVLIIYSLPTMDNIEVDTNISFAVRRAF